MIAQVWEVAWLTCLLSQDNWGDCRDSRFPVTLRGKNSVSVYINYVLYMCSLFVLNAPRKKQQHCINISQTSFLNMEGKAIFVPGRNQMKMSNKHDKKKNE